jgi:hypothetical protein
LKVAVEPALGNRPYGEQLRRKLVNKSYAASRQHAAAIPCAYVALSVFASVERMRANAARDRFSQRVKIHLSAARQIRGRAARHIRVGTSTIAERKLFSLF